MNKTVIDLTFNVAQLLREEIGSRRSYTFAEDALPLDEETMLRNLDGSVVFTRTANGVLVDVQAIGQTERPCTRCLNPATEALELRFRDEFHAKVEVKTGVPLPKPEEEDPYFITDQHMLNLGEAIREYALIGLPMQTLCRDDCKGICPTCGADLNAGSCDCPSDEGDDRFSVLKQLLQ